MAGAQLAQPSAGSGSEVDTCTEKRGVILHACVFRWSQGRFGRRRMLDGDRCSFVLSGQLSRSL